MNRASIVLASLLLGPLGAGETPEAAYGSLFATIQARHQEVARTWYDHLGRSTPSPAPQVIRLALPKCFSSLSLSLEVCKGPACLC